MRSSTPHAVRRKKENTSMFNEDTTSPEEDTLRIYRPPPEEVARWGEDFIRTASRYRFPRAIWGNPAVEQCIRLLLQAEKLQGDLRQASVRVEGYWISPADEEVRADALRKSGEYQPRRGFRPANALDAETSYALAEALMRCVVAMLQDGINGDRYFRDYIEGKANAALRGYGLCVVTREEADSSL
jgi:hypothetical protein